MAYRSVSFPMTLSDLERQDTRNQFVRWISLITLVPFDIERQNSAGKTCGERCISRRSPTPLSQDGWAQVFPIFGFPSKFDVITYMGRRRGSQRSTIFGIPFYLCVQNYQILRDNTCGGGACILESAMPPIPSELSFSAPQF